MKTRMIDLILIILVLSACSTPLPSSTPTLVASNNTITIKTPTTMPTMVPIPTGTATPSKEPTLAPSPTSTLPPNWVRKAPMTTARWSHSASIVDGIIYVFGGVGSEGAVEAYDPVFDAWTTKADLPTPRNFLSTSVVAGKIYVLGGNQGIWGPPLPALEVYDPETDTWETRTDMPTARTAHSSASVNGKIYVFGGSGNCSALTCDIFATVEEYDPATDTWTTKADMPTPRSLMASGVVNGKIYVISGFLEMRGAVGAFVEVYDPETDRWEKKADIPEVRTGAAASVIYDAIYIFGGTTAAGGRALSTIFEYDTGTDTWETLVDMPFKRFMMTTSVLNGKVYLVGGSGTRYPHDPILSEVVEVSLEK